MNSQKHNSHVHDMRYIQPDYPIFSSVFPIYKLTTVSTDETCKPYNHVFILELIRSIDNDEDHSEIGKYGVDLNMKVMNYQFLNTIQTFIKNGIRFKDSKGQYYMPTQFERLA